jgi:predicted Fe-Mo cluster-binding NifX family protein
MKVLVAANGPTLDSRVAKRFGHAPYYLCVDTATRQVQAIDNSEHHDETHAVIPHMARQGVGVFITGNIGPHAFELARSLKRRVALARNMSANEALDRLQRGELKVLSAPTLKRSIHEHDHHSS